METAPFGAVKSQLHPSPKPPQPKAAMETAPFGAVKVLSFNRRQPLRAGRNGDRSFRSGEDLLSHLQARQSAAAMETAPFGAVKYAQVGHAGSGSRAPQWRPLLSER